MKNIGKSFIGVLTLLGICFVILLIFVSLLGENNKIDDTVDNFFENIREQRYFSIKDNQNVVENFEVFDIDGEYSENCLFLELALLEKYNISDSSDYKIKIEKNHFWIPFISSSIIEINISLKNKEDSKVLSIAKDLEFVDNLFTVERKNGRWLITSINIRKSSLDTSVNRLKETLNIDSYLSISGTILTVNPIEIDTKNITIIERRKLNYIFQKLYQLTESSGNTTDEP